MEPRDPQRIRVVSGVRLRIEAGVLQIWLAKRLGGRWYAECWETAGGKVEATDETDAGALYREWMEETGYRIATNARGPMFAAEFVTPEGRVYDFAAYEVAVAAGTENLTAHSEARWFTIDEALALDRTTPSLRPILRLLAARVNSGENEAEPLNAIQVPAKGKGTWRWGCTHDLWIKHLFILAGNAGAITRISVDGRDCALVLSRIPLDHLAPTRAQFRRGALFMHSVEHGPRYYVPKGALVEIDVENDEDHVVANNAILIVDRIVHPGVPHA